MVQLVIKGNQTSLIRWSAALLLLSFGFAGPVRAQFEQSHERPEVTAQIEIQLPEGQTPFVTVSTTENRISLDLPAGAIVPMDLAAASGGFIRFGRMMDQEDGRSRLELQLAQGLLDRIDYRPDRIVLHFESWLGLQERETTEDDYLIGPQDLLQITVHNDAKMSAYLEVSKNGMITVPLVGEVTAAGLSPRNLALRLAELWGQSYLVDPKVDVQVEEYRSQWAMLSGELRSPGRVPLKGVTTLKEALNEAGGFSPIAGEEIVISHNAESLRAGEIIRVSRRKFEEGTVNPRLEHGDIVTVTRIKYCFVDGEVRRPGRVPITRGLTLMQAISTVLGVTEWANIKEIRVRKEGETGAGTIYNLKKIRRGKSPDPLLEGGEIIVVGRRIL